MTEGSDVASLRAYLNILKLEQRGFPKTVGVARSAAGFYELVFQLHQRFFPDNADASTWRRYRYLRSATATHRHCVLWLPKVTPAWS